MAEHQFSSAMPGDTLTRAWHTVTDALNQGLIVYVNRKRVSHPYGKMYHVDDPLSPSHRRMMSILGLRQWLRSLLLTGDGVIRIAFYEPQKPPEMS